MKFIFFSIFKQRSFRDNLKRHEGVESVELQFKMSSPYIITNCENEGKTAACNNTNGP